MKILVISNYNDSINSVRPEGEILIGLKKLGYIITIMTDKNGSYIQKFKDAGIQIIDFHPKKKISLKSINRIRAEIKFRDYDILFLLNSKAISNGNFASIGLPIKVVVYRGVVGGLSWLNPNSYLKHLHPRVDIILAVSKTIQKYIQSQIWWNRKKVRQFYKGQNIDWFKSISPINQKELGLPKKAFIVTCIANNRKIKGVRYLLESTNNLPPNLPIHFLLIGRKIDSKENLEIIRSSIYRDQIHLLGYRDDVCSILAISNIYIQPSLKEGLGKAILEAMSLGIPLIVTDSGGPNEYIKHMDSGILIPPKNSKEIAKQIEKLYKNEELRISIGKSAKLVIIEKLSIKDSISKLDRIIKSIHK